MRWCVVFSLTASLCLIDVGTLAQGLEREANNSLSLPASLPATEFELELAFPETRSFTQPVAIVSPPGETDRLFVVERVGRIRVIPSLENPVRETFLSMTRIVEPTSGEQGLLGLAFHPDYQRNGTFFVFYTARGTGAPNRLSRFQVDPTDPNRGLLDSEVVLFSQRDDAGNHNGGDLHFGPDGYLYVSLGDEGAANDSLRNSQRLDKDFFAGIMRIDVDKREGNLEPNPHPAVVLNEAGQANYAIPVDNPFVGATEFLGQALEATAVRSEFWAVGLRNPWRMAFDPATGELYVGDVGQGLREEVDIIQRGGNYGWNFREGLVAGPGRGMPEGEIFLDPIHDYQHGRRSDQGNSITGGIVYRGSRHASLFGAYVFADYVSGNIWSLRHDGQRATEWKNLAQEVGISGFGVDPRNGDVLLADFNSNRILRLVGAEVSNEVDSLPAKLSETGAFANLTTLTPEAGVVPYSINAPFWSDGASKSRWFSLPDLITTIDYSATGNWSFPEGSIWVKHFEIELREGAPESRRRLETRFIVRNTEGVYGLTYRWNEAQDEAFLVPEAGMDEELLIEGVDGSSRLQRWRYPSRSECLSCHTEQGGGVLGFRTAQLNRVHFHEGGMVNQLEAYAAAGYFRESIDVSDDLPVLAAPGDESQPLEARVRSYLDSNCRQCHQPGGPSIGLWDARSSIALEDGGIVGGPLANPSIHPERRVVVTGDPDASELLRRVVSLDADRMPPLGSSVADDRGIDLLRRWIGAALPREGRDDWLIRHFGATDTPGASLDGDPDGDGYPTGLEYRLGTNPLDGADTWRLRARLVNGGLELRFPLIPDPTLEVRIQVLGAIPGQGAGEGRPEDLVWRTLTLPEASQLFGDLGGMGRVMIERELSVEARFFRVLFEQE